MAARQIIVPGAMPSRDANGHALPAKLRFYVAGSGGATPKAVYADAGLTAPHAFPILSDAAGRFPQIWADEAETFDVGWSDQVFDAAIATFADVRPLDDAVLASVDLAEQAAEAAAFSASSAAASEASAEQDSASASDALQKLQSILQVLEQYQEEPVTNATNVNYTLPISPALVRPVLDRLADSVSVLDFIPYALHAGIKARTNTTDLTAYIQAAVNACGDNSYLYWPAGEYLTTVKISQPYNSQHWLGAGERATLIRFNPTAAATCVEIGTTAGQKILSSIRGFGFYSPETTFRKVAIDVIDTSRVAIENIIVNGPPASGVNTWQGNGSMGIRFRGREFTLTRNLYISADIPVRISDNPSNAIDCDHLYGDAWYLIANGNPNVLIDDGAIVSNLSLRDQAWVRGTDGLKWLDTTSAQISQGVTIEDYRFEQGEDATGYAVNISRSAAALQTLTIKRGYSGYLGDTVTPNRGYRFRGINGLTMEAITYASAGLAMDVDQTVVRLSWRDCYWQSLATASMVNQAVVWATNKYPGNGPLPRSAIYDPTGVGLRPETFSDYADSGKAVRIPLDGEVFLGLGSSGMLTIVRQDGQVAQFRLKGNFNSVNEVYDSDGLFSATKDTAGNTNIYYSATGSGGPGYYIQNKFSGDANYRLKMVGSWLFFG